MKKISLLLLCITVLVGFAVAQKEMRATNKWVVTHVADEETLPGTVTVMATGTGKKKADSEADSKTAALYVLLFRGIPGSSYSNPLISNEAEVKDNAILNDLLYKGNANSFFTSLKVISSTKLKKSDDGVKGYETVQKITIAVDALRKFLEQNNIIRKFGL